MAGKSKANNVSGGATENIARVRSIDNQKRQSEATELRVHKKLDDVDGNSEVATVTSVTLTVVGQKTGRLYLYHLNSLLPD